MGLCACLGKMDVVTQHPDCLEKLVVVFSVTFHLLCYVFLAPLNPPLAKRCACS